MGVFFIWFAVLLCALVKSDVGRIIFEDIKKIKAREKIEDWFFKLGYVCVFIAISYILLLQPYIFFMEHSCLSNGMKIILEVFPHIEINEHIYLFIYSFIFLLFFVLLLTVFLVFSSKTSKNNHRKGTLSDFIKVKLILYNCMALNPCILYMSPIIKDLKKVLQLNMDFSENILLLGILVAINLGTAIILYGIENRFYSKMMNTAFLYYEQGSDKRYIYRKIDNQFLCGNKDYLQCDRKAFDDKIKEIQDTIENQNKKEEEELDKEKKKLDKCIDKLKPYSGYIKIDEGIGKACFNVLTDCVGELEEYEGELDKFETKITKTVDEIIQVFKEMTAVELLPEDELTNYKIYPIIDEERNRFF